MEVEFYCNGVGRADDYTLFLPKFKMCIEKEDALALISELQRALYNYEYGEEDGED